MKKSIFIKASVILAVVLLMLIVIVSNTKVQAVNYYQESLYFDKDGNFFMTTHDIAATKSTRYCTLGWTIKRYNLPIDDPANMCATILLTCDGSVEDPDNERYLYSYFYCDKDTIFDAIGGVSEEWQRELYTGGSMVFLDGIMTVIENDVPLGSLMINGSAKGEVYYTYDGIAAARNWGPNSQNSLLTHFNKSVYFPAVEEFFEEGSENVEYGRIELDMGIRGPNVYSGISVNVGRYDPVEAIPAGEELELVAWQKAYAYVVDYKKISGEMACKIPIMLIAKRNVPNAEGIPVEKEVEIAETSYNVMRPYTYYTLDSVAVYYADGINVWSDMFKGVCYMDTEYIPDVEILMSGSESEHVMVEVPKEAIKVDIGELTDTEAIEACIVSAVEGITVNVKVRNDYLSIDGDVIMKDEWGNRAPSPSKNVFRAPETDNYGMSITIPFTAPNGEYKLKAEGFFGCMAFGDADRDYIRERFNMKNKIKVHTPVVCNGVISGGKEWNQAESPSEVNPSIVLGKNFAIELSKEGVHIDAKGYGERDYSEYVLHSQVKFPFDIFDEEGELVVANTWFKVDEAQEFVLPISVATGKYDVEFRTIANNFNEAYADYQDTEQNANLSKENYIATDTITVEVLGQLYGFELTEIVEYKKITDLESVKGQCNVSKLPLVKAGGELLSSEEALSVADKLSLESCGLPMGSYFRFKLESLGSYDGGVVTITPSFWYIDEDGLKEADIYYEDVRGGKIVLRKWKTDAFVVGNVDKSDSYAAENSEYHQIWTGIYMLPMRSYCIPKDVTLPAYGVDKNSFLTEGQLIVKFDIRIEDKNGENVLLYINANNAKDGYCNRWEAEGGNDGEVIVYSIDKTVKDSMKIMGTQ